jgi:type IV secretory pathway VirB4 component
MKFINSNDLGLVFFILTFLSGIYTLFNSSMFGLTLLLLLLDFVYYLRNYNVKKWIFVLAVLFIIFIIILNPYHTCWFFSSVTSIILILDFEKVEINDKYQKRILTNKKIIFEKDHYIFHDLFVQPLVIGKWPKNLVYGFLSEFVNAELPTNISIDCEYVPSNKLLTMLEVESETIETELVNVRRKNRARYIDLKLKYESSKSLQNYIASGKGTVYRVTLIFYPMAKDYKNMRKNADYIKNKLQKSLFKPAFSKYLQKQAFMSFLSSGTRNYKDDKYIQSQALATMFPFLTDLIAMKDGIFWGMNDINNSPIFINRWYFPSSHMLVTGTTGFGKSYFVKTQILRELLHHPDTKIYIIDPMNEFVDLANTMKGSVVDVGKTVINPFDLFDSAIPTKISRLKLLFNSIFEFDKNDLAILDVYLNRLYQEIKNPKFKDFIELLNDNKLSILFSSFLEGSLKNLNNDTSINLNSNFTVFNIKDVNDDLLMFYVLLSVEYLYNQISKDYSAKILVIDEVWKLLKNKSAAMLLEQLVRHVRRWKCSVMLISQKADDFLEYEEGRTIAQNAVFHVLFKHNQITQTMKAFYKLSDKEEELILSSINPKYQGYSRAYLIAGSAKVPIRIYSTDFENNIITTNPDEIKNRARV